MIQEMGGGGKNMNLKFNIYPCPSDVRYNAQSPGAKQAAKTEGDTPPPTQKKVKNFTITGS